ncbi:sulfite reductase subunit alpha [Parahaliea mediterranea]|uniref:sulfite reductase subunit alpha n=1 Tax=Parahaliea mediterranea TaxID=651086 RepID=UPI000E2ECBE7|nr:sulfite reductase subunit alpha [Parahaliea mediterranea]
MVISAAQWLQAGAITLAYLLLCGLCLRRPRAAADTAANTTDRATEARATLIAYASQGGSARALAQRHAATLGERGPVTLLALNQVKPRDLEQAHLALFIASTYGEGEPPDNALRFARQWMRDSGQGRGRLAHLHFGVLALGDSDYRHFCGFGLALNRALQGLGARPLFDAITVDRLAEASLGAWQERLLECAVLEPGDAVINSAAQADSLPAILTARECLNAGSPGSGAYHLRLAVPAHCRWQAGDIAVLDVPASGSVVQREYSIASLPEHGALELLVRQVCKDDGSYGLGSGWLTRSLAIGGDVCLRIRDNPAFHPPPAARPLILVGNGTGIAGLRAHLRARERSGASANWLVFGERTRAHDSLFDDELRQWQASGHLQRLDRVFSRDNGPQRYVQDVLAAEVAELKAWLDRDAAIYLCGSLQGMAPAVHRLLLEVLGEQGLEALTLEGRYRRDVY